MAPDDYRLPPALETEAKRVFAFADRDDNGTLDIAELAKLRNSPELAEKMVAKIDTDLSDEFIIC